ncbi:MAG: DMT family transporter [Rhabdochlamydiaceae bacterium]|nr:DMT family transporter [Candidatus Amphrikana amoebophyrae]
MTKPTPAIKNILLLLLLALIWGPSFFFIKVALKGFTPFTIVFCRLVLGGTIVLIWMKIQRLHVRSYLKYWKQYAIAGFFANALPFAIITISQKSLSSCVAAIVNSTTPLFTLIIAHFAVQGEKLNTSKVLGVLVGMGGVVTIFIPSLFSNNLKFEYMGIVGILVASLSYGIGMVYSKNMYKKHGTQMAYGIAAGQLLFAAIMVLPFFLTYSLSSFTLDVPLSSLLSLIGLGFFGTACAFILYHYILRTAGAGFLSYSALLFPIIGLSLGGIVLGEELTFYTMFGSILILCGLFISNFAATIIKRYLKKPLPIAQEKKDGK